MKREAELHRAQAKLDGFSPAKKPKLIRRAPLKTPELALMGCKIRLRGAACQVLTYLPSTCQVPSHRAPGDPRVAPRVAGCGRPTQPRSPYHESRVELRRLRAGTMD